MLKKNIPIIVVILLISIFGCMYSINAPDINNVQETQSIIQTVPDGELNFDINVGDYEGYNGRNIGWGLKKEKGKAPGLDSATMQMFEKYNTYYLDKSGEKSVFLTFDEGYENGYTAQILDVLKEKQVKAAFFVTGHYINTETELVDRMVNEGHIVGNHSYNHPNLAKSDLNTVINELKSLNDVYKERYNKNMTYLRPPEGEYSEKLLAAVNSMGYKTVFWSFAYKDWDINQQKGATYAFEQITPYLHDGAIILLHAVSADNAAALSDVIDYAQQHGFVFKSLDEL